MPIWYLHAQMMLDAHALGADRRWAKKDACSGRRSSAGGAGKPLLSLRWFRNAALLFAFVTVSLQAAGTQLPTGTNLEIRLAAPMGSRISHVGEQVRAMVIAPVIEDGTVAIPQGSTLSGTVISVHRLGWGLKHCTASLELRFDSLELPADGVAKSSAVVPLTARVLQVETAKERVTANGVIGGIHPALNLSSGFSIFISAALMEPGLAVPFMGVKFLLVRSPDPEILFPAGTELIVQLQKPVELQRGAADGGYLPELGAEDEARVRSMLEDMPVQQTERGRNDAPSDLANVVLLGKQDQIDRAFRAAGWTGAQAHNAIALYRMFYCIVSRAGYSKAPMSQLRLNGVTQQMGYQKSLDTFAKRHHIRLWKQSRPDVWLSAATEDLSFTMNKMLVNHASDRNIDNERAKIVNDLALTGCLDGASVLARDNLRIESDGWRSIVTDGKIAVLRMNDCRHPRNVTPPEHFVVPSHIAHISGVIARDIMRSNPLSLGFNTTNMILNSEDAHLKSLQANALQARTRLPRKVPAGEAVLSGTWKRPSMVASPVLATSGYGSVAGR